MVETCLLISFPFLALVTNFYLFILKSRLKKLYGPHHVNITSNINST